MGGHWSSIDKESEKEFVAKIQRDDFSTCDHKQATVYEWSRGGYKLVKCDGCGGWWMRDYRDELRDALTDLGGELWEAFTPVIKVIVRFLDWLANLIGKTRS